MKILIQKTQWITTTTNAQSLSGPAVTIVTIPGATKNAVGAGLLLGRWKKAHQKNSVGRLDIENVSTPRKETVTTTEAKITRRETLSYVKARAIILELHPTHLVLRLKGKRFRYSIDYRGIFESAAKLEARRQVEERKASRSRRKGDNR